VTMRPGGSWDHALLEFARVVVAGDVATASRLLAASPDMARAWLEQGATRQGAKQYFLDEIRHYLYRGDTALHVVAAAYQYPLARELIAAGANVSAKNRRCAEPLHYAVDGMPGSRTWNPGAQAATVVALIEAGADPNAVDKSGVTPLHRAVRTRCAAAVKVLLDNGADCRRRNKNGSTPMQIATRTTGRGGSGSAEAKAQQSEIVCLLEQHGASR
jgi:hypothetical protein